VQLTPDAIDEYLVTNVTIVTCDKAHTVHDNGALWVKTGRIAAVGAVGEFATSNGDIPVIDGGGKLLMPGLVNAHCHAGDTLFRGLVEDLPLEEWLANVMETERNALSERSSRLSATLGYVELLRSGVTSVMDMFWYPEQNFEAAGDVGIRLAGGGIFFDGVGMDGIEATERSRRATAICERYGRNEMFITGVAPHGAYTVSPENLVEAWNVACTQNGFFHIHAAETAAEQQTVIARYGRRIIEHLAALGLLEPRTLLAHCVHIDANEIALIAGSGASVVHNPMSNLKLASGFAPIGALLDAGVNVALGTDGALSGNDLDLWLAMRLAATMHKAASGDATCVSARQALHMATLSGARAIGAADRLGSLEPGKIADFILLDTSGPSATPMHDPINHLVFATSRADVTDVFVAGAQVVRDRTILTLDWPELRRDVLAMANKLRP
jgi:5-methylthioadenosine/S-adenosylhomocysteine deaminase